jgi:hypothetical protein
LPPLILRFSYSAVGFVLAASISLRPGFRFVREDWLRTVLVSPTSERAADFGSRCEPADFPEQPPPFLLVRGFMQGFLFRVGFTASGLQI